MTVPNTQTFLKSLGIRDTQLEYLDQIIHTLLELQITIDEATAVAEELENRPRCCGSEYMDRGGFVYANHGINDICPLHGQHPKHPGKKRLRLYIGNKPEAILELQEALENWSKWHKAQRKVRREKERLKQLVKKLEMAKHVASSNGWH